MDFRVNRETISTNEVVFDSTHEQPIELDCILPDYCPDIFRVVKCITDSKVVSQRVSDDRVSYEMVVSVRVLYCSEHECAVRCIHQKATYSRTVEFGKPYTNPCVDVTPKVDYVNCRVVNKRRLDLRGALSVRVKVNHLREQSVVCDAFGMNVQLKRLPVDYTVTKARFEKTAIVTEDTFVPQSKPPIANVLKHETTLNLTEVKDVADKVVAKGEVCVRLLYTPDKENPLPETMSFSFPFSQILDVDERDGAYTTNVLGEVVSCDVTVNPDDSNLMKKLTCDVSIRLVCVRTKEATTTVVTDAYSTKYLCDTQTATIRVSMPPTNLDETFQLKEVLAYDDGEVSTVCDCWATLKNVTYRLDLDGKAIALMGVVQYCVLVETSSNMVTTLEKDCGFDYSIPLPSITEGTTLEPELSVHSCSYNLNSSREVSVKVDLNLSGKYYEDRRIEALSEITLDEGSQKLRDGDYSIKLYYGIKGEDVWDIAKKYSTSADSVIEENSLEGRLLQSDGMILIPIAN